MKWSELSSEEKERYLRFASDSTRDNLIKYRDHNDHHEEHRLPKREIKPNKWMQNYLEQFKDKIVKN